jgi:hypothetical protein
MLQIVASLTIVIYIRKKSFIASAIPCFSGVVCHRQVGLQEVDDTTVAVLNPGSVRVKFLKTKLSKIYE